MGPNGSNDDLEDDFEDFEDFDEQEEHTPVPETLREPKPEPGMGVLDDDDLGDVA